VGVPLNPEADPDVQLMLAVQRGDRFAFEQLFEKHARGVVGFAAQFVGAHARAEELAQDVFLQIYRTRARYLPTARFTTWLYRMVTNACLSEVRRADHRSRVRLADPLHEQDDDPGSLAEVASSSSEEVVLSQESLNRLRVELDQLPAQQRAALLLARVQGLSYEEVAEALTTSVSAVKSLIHRATVTLRDRMQEEHK
jgi:RNA polymerase sigma-70 factor (ECF subfamily)